MSLWLCRQEHVKHPYYVEDLGIRLYSSQELAYVIFNHPLLVMDGFVNENLLAFLRDELNLGFLALKLERWLKSGENPDETLILILQECDYHTSQEISRYRQLLAEMRKKHPADYKKRRADELFLAGQYRLAVQQYRELLEYPSDSFVDNKFTGRIWNNIGSCYARMFRLDQAMEAYETCYRMTEDQKALERMYELTFFDHRLALTERQKSLISDELRGQWDKAVADARGRAVSSGQMAELEELFGRDPIKRQAGEAELVRRWKQEYRNMV